MIFLIFFLIFLSLICLFFAFRQLKRKRLIQDIPTSKTTGVFIGMAELKGTAESDSPVIGYLSESPCVYYTWAVRERWSRLVTRTVTDSQGNTRTETHTESGWETVAEGGEQIPFYIKDDYGVVRILPEGAKIEPLTTFSVECGESDPLYYAKGPQEAIAHSDYERDFTECAIPLHAELYVLGKARERKDIVAPEIAADKTAARFLISTRTEQKIVRGHGWGFWILWILGLLLLGGVGLWLAQESWKFNYFLSRRQSVESVLLGVGVYLLCSAIGWVILVYNGLVDLRQRVRQAWSQVDIQLKRRFDLIPNLKQVVEGMKKHEAELLNELAKIRNQLVATPPGVDGPDFAALHKSTLIIAEKYPSLKANDSFLYLQKMLSDTEHRIALARGYFNEIATYYNTRLETIPEKFVANLGAMKPQPLMAINGFERAPIAVEFKD